MTERSAAAPKAQPYWADAPSFPAFATLDRDIDVDVVVIGGGVTGLSTAYLLVKAGMSVAVLERDRCAGADTGHTSAHLTMVTDARLPDLVQRFGQSHAQAAWDAGLAAIAQIDMVVRDHQIDCGFEWVDGFLHAPSGAAARDVTDTLRKEAALAASLGFDAGFVEDVPLFGGPGIRFDGQARFHPRQYLAALANAVVTQGGQIYEHSAAEAFCAAPLGVTANGHRVTCRDIVIATHNPLVGVASTTDAALFQTKLALYTSYVIGALVPSGTVPDALFWDTADPYHYLRIEPRRDGDLVIFGGEDHKTGQAPDTLACFDRLEGTLAATVPGLTVTHRWSGQVIETPDGLPYIGRMADHQYAATGFSGNGLTFGTMSAMILSDAIMRRRNPWTELFDPGRTAIGRGLWEYIKENADYPYYMIRDRFAGTDARSLRSVKREQGAVIEQPGGPVAAYRDAAGALSLHSAICPHLGCQVGWNAAERTWDCPCHGSRFGLEGQVIAGPAEAPLPEAKS